MHLFASNPNVCVVVQKCFGSKKFSNQFDLYFPLSLIMVMNTMQIKI